MQNITLKGVKFSNLFHGLIYKSYTHFRDEILFSFMYNVAFNKKIYVKFSNFDFPISSATF